MAMPVPPVHALGAATAVVIAAALRRRARGQRASRPIDMPDDGDSLLYPGIVYEPGKYADLLAEKVAQLNSTFGCFLSTHRPGFSCAPAFPRFSRLGYHMPSRLPVASGRRSQPASWRDLLLPLASWEEGAQQHKQCGPR